MKPSTIDEYRAKEATRNKHLFISVLIRLVLLVGAWYHFIFIAWAFEAASLIDKIHNLGMLALAVITILAPTKIIGRHNWYFLSGITIIIYALSTII